MHVTPKPSWTVAIAFLVLLFVTNSFGQEPKRPSPVTGTPYSTGDECGDPAVESQRYAQRSGKVTKILSSTEVLFQSSEANGNKENRTYTIQLVGISPKQNSAQIERFLKENVLNRPADVVGNGIGKKDTKYGGIIRILDDDSDIDDLNEYLLEEGLAAYLDFKSNNLIPYYWPCRLEKAQTQAKSAKLGIWRTEP